MFLNGLTNYVPKVWSEEGGCLICKEWQRTLPTEESQMPLVVVALFIEMPTPFLQDMLERVYQLNYPKSRIHLWVHNGVSYFAGSRVSHNY